MEHDALLIRDVERRIAPVLALLEARTWPYAELGTLIAFLRSAPVRLPAVTARLEKAHQEPCPLPELRGIVDELIASLPAPAERELALASF